MSTHGHDAARHPNRWLLDLGNTRLKFAREDARGEPIALDIAERELAARALEHIGPARPGDEAWLAAVAPVAVAAALESALRDAGYRVHRAQSQARMGQLRIAYRAPAHLGVDRFLALLAASRRSDGPWLLVSAGSALTLDLLQADGLHLGGAIAPMPDTMRAALAARFAALDLPAGRCVDFADDTADAVASGCLGAALGLVERGLRQARLRLGEAPTLLLGGGAAGLFAGIDAARVVASPTLVLDGLAIYASEGPR